MLEFVVGIGLIIIVAMASIMITKPTEDERKQDLEINQSRVDLSHESYWRYDNREY